MSPLTQSKSFWIALTAAVILSVSAVLVWRTVSAPAAETTPTAGYNTPTVRRSPTSPHGTTTPSADSTSPSTTTPSTSSTNSEPTADSGSTTDNADFGACTEDAQLYCSGFYGSDWEAWATANGYTTASWKLGLVDCLGQNRDKTSEACHESMDRRAALNEAVNTECKEDRATYCAGIEPKPDSEPEVDCLKDHYSELSAACAAAVDAHEAAKPTDQQDTY